MHCVSYHEIFHSVIRFYKNERGTYMINHNIMPGEGLADPHALVEDEFVYIFCGHDKSYKTEDTWIMDKWCILRSNNLIDWNKIGEILPEQTYIGKKDNCWAGYIVKKDQKYFWFFSNKNIDIGVVVSDRVEGPYMDVLGKPLIPQGTVPVCCYDPCVYEENGIYTMFFGSGKYYCVELDDSLLSMRGKPEPILVVDKNGKELTVDDKSTVFKRNGRYYLCYGSRYAMSDYLKGPYTFQGQFVGGGHNDVFQWNHQLYVCNEFHDTSIFYRGIRVEELNFADDGTVILPLDNSQDIAYEKTWDFTSGCISWFDTDYQDLSYSNGRIMCCLSRDKGFRSPVFPGILLGEDNCVSLCFQVEQEGNIEIRFETVGSGGIYWEKEPYVTRQIFHVFPGTNDLQLSLKINRNANLLRKVTLFAVEGNMCLYPKRIAVQSNI